MSKILKLNTQESPDFFEISSCIVYDDIMYNELHDLEVKEEDIVIIKYENKGIDIIRIEDIEHLDGTIWVEILESNYG